MGIFDPYQTTIKHNKVSTTVLVIRITVTSHERHGVSNHQKFYFCLGKPTQISNIPMLTLRAENPPVTDGFPWQRASNAESFPCHDVTLGFVPWVRFIMLHLATPTSRESVSTHPQRFTKLSCRQLKRHAWKYMSAQLMNNKPLLLRGNVIIQHGVVQCQSKVSTICQEFIGACLLTVYIPRYAHWMLSPV